MYCVLYIVYLLNFKKLSLAECSVYTDSSFFFLFLSDLQVQFLYQFNLTYNPHHKR